MRFTLIDLFIVIAVIFAISSGYRRGFWLSLAQYTGLVLGVVVGAALAPVLMDALHMTGPTARSSGSGSCTRSRTSPNDSTEARRSS